MIYIVIENKNGLLVPATHPAIHVTELLAREEAKRLAKTNVGKHFMVFESGWSVSAEVQVSFVEKDHV